MGLGATLKVGMDAKEVKAGLSRISGMFKKLGKGAGIGLAKAFKAIPGIGVGIAAGVGGLTALTVGTAKWVKNLKVMSDQTGVAIPKILQLNQAWREAGIEVDSTTDLLGDLQEKIEDAAREGGTGQEGYSLFGLSARSLRQIADPMQQLDTVMRAVQNSGQSFQTKKFGLDKIFGGEGMKLTHLANNWDAFMEEAGRDTRDLGEALEDNLVGELLEVNKILGRMKISFKVASLGLLKALPLEQINATINKVMASVSKFLRPAGPDSPGPLKMLKNTWSWLKQEIVALWQKFMGMFWEVWVKMESSIRSMIPQAPTLEGVGAKVKAFLGGASNAERKNPSVFPGVGPLTNTMQNVDRTLLRIERQPGARFA